MTFIEYLQYILVLPMQIGLIVLVMLLIIAAPMEYLLAPRLGYPWKHCLYWSFWITYLCIVYRLLLYNMLNMPSIPSIF